MLMTAISNNINMIVMSVLIYSIQLFSMEIDQGDNLCYYLSNNIFNKIHLITNNIEVLGICYITLPVPPPICNMD